MPSRVLVLVVLSLLALNGCAEPNSANRKEVPILDVHVLYSGLYCGGEIPHPTAAWIADGEDLQQLQQRLIQQGVDHLTLPRLDFSQEGVLFIAMGQRPTGGYRLALGTQPVRVEAQTLEVPVTWTEPAPGYAQIQVITSPCLLLKLPAVPFQRIRVVDQQGQVRIETTR